MTDEKPMHYHIKNWEKYQPQLKEMRDKNARLSYVRDYTSREDDHDWLQLSMFQRALLQSLTRLVGRTPSRCILTDVKYISSACQVPAMERSRVGQAIVNLVSNGFLVPCFEQDECGYGYGEGEEGDTERKQRGRGKGSAPAASASDTKLSDQKTRVPTANEIISSIEDDEVV